MPITGGKQCRLREETASQGGGEAASARVPPVRGSLRATPPSLTPTPSASPRAEAPQHPPSPTLPPGLGRALAARSVRLSACLAPTRPAVPVLLPVLKKASTSESGTAASSAAPSAGFMAGLGETRPPGSSWVNPVSWGGGRGRAGGGARAKERERHTHTHTHAHTHAHTLACLLARAPALPLARARRRRGRVGKGRRRIAGMEPLSAGGPGAPHPCQAVCWELARLPAPGEGGVVWCGVVCVGRALLLLLLSPRRARTPTLHTPQQQTPLTPAAEAAPAPSRSLYCSARLCLRARLHPPPTHPVDAGKPRSAACDVSPACGPRLPQSPPTRLGRG